jgi:hypothetical protein
MSSRSWVEYHQRMHTMLQEGRPAADIAIYYGDFSPITVGPENPVPHGYDFDYINSDILLNHLKLEEGRWVIDLPDASSYGALVIPDTGYLRPAVARRIAELKEADAPVIESLPVTTGSLVRAGLDPVVWDGNQDFKWKLREIEEGCIFLLCNFERTGPFEANLKVEGLRPELFDPVTGEVRRLATYQSVKGGTRVRFQVRDLADSCFLVFRKPADGDTVTDFDAPLDLWFDEKGELVAGPGPSGNYAVTFGDGSPRQLVIDAGSAPIELKGNGEADARGLQSYTGSFALTPGILDKPDLRIDLGDVSIMAGGTLNGHPLETRWMPPFSWEVGELLEPGENHLRITVSPLNQNHPASIGGPVRLKWQIMEWN